MSPPTDDQLDRRTIARAVFAVALAWGSIGAALTTAFVLGRVTVDKPAPQVYVVTSTTSSTTP